MYTIEKVSNLDHWDELVSLSDYNNIFFKSFFFKYLQNRIDLKYIKKGNEIKAGFFLVTDQDKKIIYDDDVTIYSGIIFFNDKKQIRSSKNIETFKIITYFIDYINKKYSSANFSTVINFPDLRPFLWYNYKNKGPKFKINPRYTSILNISDLAQEGLNSTAYKHMSSLRKRLLRKGLELKPQFKYDYKIDYLIEKFKEYMIKQKQDILKNKLVDMKNLIINLSEKNKIFIQETNYLNQDFTYTLIFSLNDNSSTFLYGFPNGIIDDSIGTVSFWNVFNYLSKKKIDYVDLEGINSPLRGQFKQSFGGENKIYYNLEIYRNEHK